MQLHDLFEGNEQAYNWHSEPEQRNIDATRQSRLYREREPEGSEAIDARIRARYDQLDQYNQSGKFWLKQKDTQEHISDAMIGKAAATAAAVELLKQRPELKGNLVITAYGPGESQGVAEGEKSPMAKDAQRADRIRSLKNLIAIAREQGRQLRVQELELELKKLQGVTEMDSQGYTGSRDRKKTSKYGSRDHYDLGGPESTGRPLTAKQMMDRAHKAMLKSMSNDEKVDKGWRNPNVDEGTEQVYNILALDKGNALKKPTKLKWKASSLEDIFDALAAQDWYPLEINGVEVIAGKRLKQGVAEGSGNIGSAIKSLYRKIYRAGDDEIEYFYNASPIFAQYWDEYEGDLDSIIAEVDPEELAVIKAELESYVQDANLAEGDDDVWGPQGNFAGDKPVNLGGSVSKKLAVDDTVTYFGEKATILAMSKDRSVSRIHLKSGITQNVKTSDLKRVGQGMAEAPGAETLSHNQSTVASNLNSLDLDEGWKEKLGAAALAGSMALGAAGANAGALGTDTTWSPNKPVATQQATDTSYIGGKPQADYNTDTRILTYKGKQYKQDINAQATGKGEIVTAPSIAVGSRNMFPTKVELHPNGTYSRAVANEGDISQLEKDIADAPVAPIANMEADEKIGGRYDADDFDAMVSRLKKLAGAGPMKTVYDPNKRVYRNVPTAVQPAQQPKK